MTIVDFHGNIDRKYVVGFQYALKPRRAKSKEGYPATDAENLERLTNAGFIEDRGIPLCSRCGGKCPQLLN
jgi:hypothetical protein